MAQSAYDRAYNIAYVRARDEGLDPEAATTLAEEKAEEEMFQ